MKGVILAGGLGSRLRPATLVTNKHLLPVYDKPMIFYPIQALVNAGIEDILVVTGGNNAGDFLRLLGNGKEFGLKHLNYTYQEGEGGIADALSLAEHFVGGDRVCVILGDNIIEKNIIESADRFRAQERGAKILTTEVDHPERFGVVKFEPRLPGEPERIADIIEKPSDPPSRTVVTGLYFYDAHVFDICRSLEPSVRGEYEITDVNRAYLREGTLTRDPIDGWWIDVGTHDALLEASNRVSRTGANNCDETPRDSRALADA